MPPRLLPSALAGAALILAAAPVASLAQDVFTSPQKEEMGRVIREYLMKNPEVIQDAIAELEKRQGEAQKSAQATALNELRDTLVKGGTVVGNPTGDVTLVEFFDYNCGYCKQAVADLRTLIKADGKLRVVLRDLTIIGGASSEEASRVALAAKGQLTGDKLFEYHTRVMETRGRVNGERALAVAKEMGLDMARVQKDMASPAISVALGENASYAQKLGVNGTPAYVVGDEVVSGAIGAGALRQAVTGVRQCGRVLC